MRRFVDSPLTDEELDRILEAGRRTPSASNAQPWDLIVVTDRSRLGELAGVWRGAGHVATSAATIAIVVPVVEDGRRAQLIEYDLGQLTIQMAIAAADLGIGSGHAAVEDQELFRTILGVPSTHRGAYLLALGRPADRPLAPIKRPDRRAFDEVVHRERW